MVQSGWEDDKLGSEDETGSDEELVSNDELGSDEELVSNDELGWVDGMNWELDGVLGWEVTLFDGT